MDDHDSKIVSRLKDPWKFIFVDMDIAVLCTGIGMALLMSNLHTFFVVGVPACVGYYIHRSRQDKPRGYLMHLLYWLMPPLVLPLKRVPPMYCVRTVG